GCRGLQAPDNVRAGFPGGTMHRLIVIACMIESIAVARSAAACVLPPPSRARTSVPADGDAKVPTSVRPRVQYRQGAYAQAACGAAAPAPPLPLAAGDGGALSDAGASSDGGALPARGAP